MDRARVAERQRCGRNFTGMSLDRKSTFTRVRPINHSQVSPKTYTGSEYSDTQAVLAGRRHRPAACRLPGP